MDSTVTAATPTAKPKFQFGGGGEKCKTCTKTVYPQEKICYDQGVWHTGCFKCLSCKSTLSLTAVAMIDGQLYCKTCFKKTFLREGRYSTFNTQKFAEAKAGGGSGGGSGSASGQSTPPSETVTNTSVTVSEATQTSPSNANASTDSSTDAITDSVADFTITNISSASRSPLEQLVFAIESKDSVIVQSLVNKHGLSLLFQPYKSCASIIEWSVGNYLHKAMGVKMIEMMKEMLNDAGLLKPVEDAQA